MLPIHYKPSSKEAFMNPMQKEYFRQLLLRIESECVENFRLLLDRIRTTSNLDSDDCVQATLEEELFTNCTMIEHHNAELKSIRWALQKIQEGHFGYCEETGDPIPLGRLLVMPTARFSTDFQKTLERHDGNNHGHHNIF
jgi:DnaK suppressor protein